MPRGNVAAELTKVLSKLLAQRKKHLAIIAKNSAKVAEIEGLFGQFGVSLEAPKPVANGTKQAKRAKGRRRRGLFPETADQFVLGMLKGKTLTTAELTAAWSKSGRGGRVDNSLTRLTKAKQVKREKVKGSKRSQYRLA